MPLPNTRSFRPIFHFSPMPDIWVPYLFGHIRFLKEQSDERKIILITIEGAKVLPHNQALAYDLGLDYCLALEEYTNHMYKQLREGKRPWTSKTQATGE